jgi:hypothetical protein
MDQSSIVQDIIDVALARYGNFEDPDFHFVQPALDKSPMRSIYMELEALGAHITEDTDPNNDVSLGFLIEKNSETLFLQLSIVGSYAALRRVSPSRPNEAIASLNDARTEMERDVVTIVARRAQLLNRSILLSSVKFNLSNMKPDETTIYNLLFTDGLSGL